MSRFYFGSGPSSISSSDSEDNLPYPEALPRSDFLSRTFSAPSYLSTLSSRHQTLEDLRSDLRERSQALSKELLDLVNANYEQFLSLGSDLRGGEERVEDVRVGLLGFRRGLEDVRARVRERRGEMLRLLREKRGLGREIAVGRGLLEVDARLAELEERLMVVSLGKAANGHEDEEPWSDSEEEDEEGDGEGLEVEVEGGTSTRKLQRIVEDYRQVEQLSTSVGKSHPFIVAQESRMMRVRNTILLDLSTSLKQAVASKEGGEPRVIRVLGIYRDLGAGEEAIRILKDLKSR